MLRPRPNLCTLPPGGQSESGLQLLAERQMKLQRDAQLTYWHNHLRAARSDGFDHLCSPEIQSSSPFPGNVHGFGERALLLEVLR